jgi:hypothetical protein
MITSWTDVTFFIFHSILKDTSVSSCRGNFKYDLDFSQQQSGKHRSHNLIRVANMEAPKDPSSSRPFNCALCGQPAQYHCTKCTNTYYCCREHQKQDWKIHKKVCASPNLSSENEPVSTPHSRAGNVGMVMHFNPKSFRLILSDALSDMSIIPLAEVNVLSDMRYPVAIEISQDNSILLVVGQLNKNTMSALDCWSIPHTGDTRKPKMMWRYKDPSVDANRAPALNKAGTRAILQSSPTDFAFVFQDEITVLDIATGAVLHKFYICRSMRTAVVSAHDNLLISVACKAWTPLVQMWNTNVPMGENMNATMESHAIPSHVAEAIIMFPVQPNCVRYIPCPKQPWIALETMLGGIVWDYSSQKEVVSAEAWKKLFNEKQMEQLVPRLEFGQLQRNDHVLLARVHRSDTALRWICLDVTANTVLYRISLGPASLDYAMARFNAARQSFIYLASLVYDDGLYYLYEIDAKTGTAVSKSPKPILGATHFHVANAATILM